MKIRYIIAAAVFGAMTACTSEVTDSVGFANDPDAVRILATVGDLQSRSNPIDEDGADPTKFNKGDRIEVDTEEQYRVVYVLGDTGWNPEGNDYLKWNKDSHRFFASYPAGIYNILEDQSTLENLRKSDLMETNANLSKNSTGSISLNFKRRLARIVISKTIDWGTQYDDTYSVTDLQVHTIMGKQVKPYSGKDNYYAIVNSDNVAESQLTFLTIKVQSSRQNSEETYTVTGIPLHEAGKSYQYELRIGRDKAEISSVTVADWQIESITSGETFTHSVSSTESQDENGVKTYRVYNDYGLLWVKQCLTGDNATEERMKSTIILEDNITLSDKNNWTAIGTNALPYTGTFDGKGYTITGLNINSTEDCQGFIGCLGASGTVKNVTLKNSMIAGGTNVGSIVGKNQGTVSDCHVDGGSVTGTSGVGGFIGSNSGTLSGTNTVTGCTITGTTNTDVNITVGNDGDTSAVTKGEGNTLTSSN